MDLSASDRDLITRTVLGEAGDQPDEGKAAVASVILNRLRSGQYGDSIPKIVLAPNQFEPWQTRRSELLGYSPESKSYKAASQIVDEVAGGKIEDPTGGATHFYAPVAQRLLGRNTPSWSNAPLLAKIGGHNFYAPEGAVPEDLLGEWGSKSAPAQDQNQDQGEDLLGSWGAPATPVATTAAHPRQILITAPWDKEPPKQEDEDLSKFTNRLLAEHQGDSWADRAYRLEAGALRGVGDVADTIANGVVYAGTHGANALQNAGIISPQTNQTVQNWAQGVTGNVLADRNAFDALAANSPLAQAGRVGGQVLGTGPLVGELGLANGLSASRPILGSIIGGAGAGAAANALTSSASDEPIGNQILEGGVAGGMLGPLGHGASALGAGARNLLFGSVSPETAALADAAVNKYGIPVTAGQISSNPMVRFADSVLQRMPLSGYGARTEAQQTGLNRAIANEMGVSSDVITPDVVRQAKQTAYNDYDAAKANLAGPLNVGRQFYDDLINIHDNAHYVLEDSLSKKVDNLLGNVADKVNNHTIDADQYQSLTRKNGPLDNAINSRDSKISTYASQIKDALENVVGRNSPELKRLKDEADYKYFVAKSIEPLANEATTGNISPAKLLRAVDFSQTPVGEIGRIGQRFLKEPPSSGTSERLLAMELLKGGLGAAGIAGTYAFDPDNFQRNALIGAAALTGGRAASSILRSRALTNALINSGLGRAGGGQKLANFLSSAAPIAALTYRGNSNALAGH